MSFRAVIFDLGGVVLGSPLQAIAAYERDRGVPGGFVNRLVRDTGHQGAWSRLERGELDMEGFYGAFDRECAAGGHPLSGRELMECIARESQPRAEMLTAIRRIRAEGLQAGALTNNWAEQDGESRMNPLREHFHVFVESSVEGLRKPDPEIYRLVCRRLGIEPVEAVFLDDIGGNLKPARALGMTTLKVVDPDTALAELSALLGFALA